MKAFFFAIFCLYPIISFSQPKPLISLGSGISYAVTSFEEFKSNSLPVWFNNISFSLEFFENKTLSIETGLGITFEGYKFSVNEFYDLDKITAKYSLVYGQLSTRLNYNILSKSLSKKSKKEWFNCFAFVGMNFNGRLSSKWNYADYYLEKNNAKSNFLALNITNGLKFHLTKRKFNLGWGIRYHHGIINVRNYNFYNTRLRKFDLFVYHKL